MHGCFHARTAELSYFWQRQYSPHSLKHLPFDLSHKKFSYSCLHQYYTLITVVLCYVLKSNSSVTWFIFSKIVSATLEPLKFHIKLRKHIVISTHKNIKPTVILIAIESDLWTNLGRTGIWTALSFLSYCDLWTQHNLPLTKSSVLFLTNVCTF